MTTASVPRQVWIDKTDSTNAEALRWVEQGHALPAWIIAREQTAGKGRRGRAWFGAVGNFYGTLVLSPRGGPADWMAHSFIAALAVEEAVVAHAPGAHVALKWPNDVLLDGGKCAGILLESTGGAAPVLRIGIGVNLASAPDAAALDPHAVRPVALPQPAPDVTAFAKTLVSAYARWMETFQQKGFDPIRRAWLARAKGVGQRITARTQTEAWTGIFADLDRDGALLLDQDGDMRKIHAADVFFGTQD